MNVFLMMRQFSIRLRMLGAIAMVLLLLGMLGGAGLFGMFRAHQLSKTFMDGSFTEVQLMAKLHDELGEIRMHEKNMIIQYEKPEGVREAHKFWLEHQDKAKKLTAHFQEIGHGPESALVREIAQRLDAYRDGFAHVVRQLEASGYDTATVANRMSGKAVAEFAEIDKLMQQLDTMLDKEVEKSVAVQKRDADQIFWLFIGALLVAVIVVVPLTLLNMQSICKPLAEAQAMARAIAGGDLSQTIAAEGHDEVSDLQRALREMQEGLGQLVSQVRDTSGHIATASQQIASGNQDLSTRTEQTASNAQQAVSSLAQLTSTVQQTASSSQTANQLAMSASGTAKQGGKVVQQAVASMQEIASSSRKINDIIGLIDSIAFQTNILALNAAVEAARAGEQGRGFAVVAGEVRSLAQRSAAAASEIKTLISSSVQAVDGGVRHVEDAGNAMNEIVASVQRVGDIIGEITAASSEQTAGIGHMNEAVGEIDRMTQQNAALVEESAAAADSLRDQAMRLSHIVQQFRLADAGHESPGLLAPHASSVALAAPVAEGIDLEKAIKAHAQWRTKLREAARHREHLDADTIARDDCCDLGRWLHGSGQSMYGNRPQFVELVDRHREFHEVAGEIANSINKGHYAEAEEALSGNTPFSHASSAVGAAIVQLRKNI